jgi:GPI transamidase subunit PIG-U
MIGLERRIIGSGKKTPPFAASLSPPATSSTAIGATPTTTSRGRSGETANRRVTEPDHSSLVHDRHEDGRSRSDNDGLNGCPANPNTSRLDSDPSHPCNDTSDEAGTVKSNQFIRSQFTKWAVLARMLLLFDLVPPDLQRYLQHPSLACIVVDPTFMWRHVLEARAIRNLFRPPSFGRAYQLHSAVHLPPLLLAAMDAIANCLDMYPARIRKVTVGLILLLIDVAVALLFERVADKLLSNRDSQREYADGAALSWEETLERRMPEAIQPPLKHLFFGTTTKPSLDNGARGAISDNDDGAPALSDTGQNPDTEARQQPPLFPLSELPAAIACAYFGCPITIVAAHAHECLRNLPLMLLLWAVHAVMTATDCEAAEPQRTTRRGRPSFVIPGFLMALAAYVDVHFAVFAIPLVLFASGDQAEQRNQRTLMMAFAVYFFSLHLLSFMLIGGNQYPNVVSSSHLYSFQLANQPPNLSVLWYFGMEVFLRFQRFFVTLLGGLPYVLIVPLTIRLWRYPEVLVRQAGRFVASIYFNIVKFSQAFPSVIQMTIFWMLGVLFRPPSTLYQLLVGMCLAAMCPKSCIRMRTLLTLVSLCALPIPATLFVVTHWLWLVPGSGEANFTYFQALAYSAFAGLVTVEFTGASLRRDKALRLTEKEESSSQRNDSNETNISSDPNALESPLPAPQSTLNESELL